MSSSDGRIPAIPPPPAGSPPPPQAGRGAYGPDICQACHKSGHTTRDCPSKGRASERTSRTNPPPEPCWSCDEMHWSHECEIGKARREARHCVLCGSQQHWLRGCDKYDAAVHTPRNSRGSGAVSGPKTTYFDMGGGRHRECWCLKCGVADHATMDCNKSTPPVIVPECDAEKQRMGSFRTFCGYMGHSFDQCMRRGVEISQPNTGNIRGMQDELAAIKKSVNRVDDMQTSLETLNTQMAALITWQTEVVNPALQQVRNATEELSNLKPQVSGLTQSKTTAQQEIT